MLLNNLQEQTSEMKKPQPENIVFSLDIGTRSVIGVVGMQEDDRFKVIESERIEHTKRSMMDGQIEDIEQVSKIILAVKTRLEKRLGYSLERVAIAAAGRALRTQKMTVRKDLDSQIAIDKNFVESMEIEAIQIAQQELDNSMDDAVLAVPFYCVGHSVTKQMLDRYPISNLVGHKGKHVELELIATFLPSSVVESLYAVMELNDLSISSLTLEPIAAINVLIPTELRMLNLALVDIGAGTSDIAVSKDGAISAYAMATIAGDEITEAIIRACLVDFASAEKIKHELSNDKNEIGYTDILSVSHIKSKDEITEYIMPSVERLCDIICEKIIEINEVSPSAVFLVGGGSLVPRLDEFVAAKLKLEPARVAVGNQNFLKSIIVSSDKVDGPEYVTPIGIAVTSVIQRGYDFYSITLNEEKVKIFNNKTLSVNDIMLMAGYKSHQLIGLSGRSVSFELNGEKKIVRGELSTPGAVYLNGETVSINEIVKAGDIIKIVQGINGEAAQVKLFEVLDKKDFATVFINGLPVAIGTTATVNGERAELDYQIENYDVIITTENNTLADALATAEVAEEGYFKVNSEHALLDQILHEGDVIEQIFEPLPKEQRDNQSIKVTINDILRTLVEKEDGSPHMFLDALNYVDIDPTKPEGELVLNINGHSATYTETISDGDVIIIGWKR